MIMEIYTFRELLHEDIAIASNLSKAREKEEFLSYATRLLIEAEEFDDFYECHCEGLTRRNGRYEMDGYSVEQSDGSCCVFLVDYHGTQREEFIRNEDIITAFRKLRFFVEESIKNELYREISNQAAKEFSRDLFYSADSITKFRFFLLTDSFNRQRDKSMKDETIDGKTVELNVWDIERFYDLVRSTRQKESVEINVSDYGCEGIPCVKAVEYQNVVADIDDLKIKEDDSPKNIITYSSYLAAVPGEILNKLYLDYGAKLLEGNVRSFLSAKVKVNKGIKTTIKNYPEMFFAYNNGIAATATQIKVKQTANGLAITYIKDLQIVNGGQTTASIANALLTAKSGEKVELSKVYVPMKLSVLDHSMAERIIPKISEYSNSQNKVDASDFFSNHPFHIRMEEYSRKTRIPSRSGNQFEQYWFYERARGQYNQGKMKYIKRKADLKKYTDRYPENQIITMLDLAKYMELYFCNPHIVSKGKQKTLQEFAKVIKLSWDERDTEFNELYFKRVVALAILYKRTDEIIKQSEWYKENHSYKANVIAYTISILFNYVNQKHKEYELDFERIWNEQDIYEELEEQIDVLQQEVHNFIIGPRSVENVTEWCKRDECWSRAKAQMWSINDAFIATLENKEVARNAQKTSAGIREIENEIDDMEYIFAQGQEYWNKVLKWGKQEKMLTEKEESILTLCCHMFMTGKLISDKQAKIVKATRKKLIDNGMPMKI